MNSRFEMPFEAANSDGEVERLYECSFIDPNGHLRTFKLYGKNLIDAMNQLDALKASAAVDGRLVDVVSPTE